MNKLSLHHIFSSMNLFIFLHGICTDNNCNTAKQRQSSIARGIKLTTESCAKVSCGTGVKKRPRVARAGAYIPPLSMVDKDRI
ncbi:hypothetical protein PSECIP111951_00863 [Pseudoalteromonas holothuriae]|uniref:Uncharacterized protein n=1 Tax=Pseudoalteromonas holothuriae TaxID=2963714 RepID=A0A9W4QW60_9GAMM|nr:hypothetical protein PSECIP111951_00863 [Pseudoalteromonas sp. CIP111951]CAH9055918.1 hypothetical protein PSECIP111854_01681 [Pseudoalteromonas sp. CIP111854]